ncbi:MAG: M1 family metallopeptidase, partial [Gammaproteobacteria bacterium]
MLYFQPAFQIPENTLVDPASYKLPNTVCPERYQLRLTPNLKAFRFAGEETITVKVREPVKKIVLNAAELTIRALEITSADGETLKGTATLDEPNERAILTFPETLMSGYWNLRLSFSGILNDKLRGFYHSTYNDANGADKVLACTQFEPTDARRAFPCWDEPAFQAVFQVTGVSDKDLTAISNT